MNKGSHLIPPNIHPSSAIHPDTEIGSNVMIGPFCRVDAGVTIGDNVKLQSHVVVEGTTKIGSGTLVSPFTSLGGSPQHTQYKGEPTCLEIGENSILREHVSVHRGTPFGGGTTRLGANCHVMATCHIAHDCQIGDDVIVGSNTAIAGHVIIEDRVFVGGQAGIHQFCRVGKQAIVGGGAVVVDDIIPFGSAVGNQAELGGLNVIGMKRSGLGKAKIHELRTAFRNIFMDDQGTFQQRINATAEEFATSPEVMMIVAFLKHDTRRPIMGARKEGKARN